MTKQRQPKTETRRGIRLTAEQEARLAWLCEQEARSWSNMIGRLVDLEYERRAGPPVDLQQTGG